MNLKKGKIIFLFTKVKSFNLMKQKLIDKNGIVINFPIYSASLAIIPSPHIRTLSVTVPITQLLRR